MVPCSLRVEASFVEAERSSDVQQSSSLVSKKAMFWNIVQHNIGEDSPFQQATSCYKPHHILL